MEGFKLKIKLLDIAKPPVWRDVLIAKDTTFEDLHYIIQIAMGWEFSHLYQFIVGNKRNGIRIGSSEFDMEMGMVDDSSIFVESYLQKPKDKCWYEYDFGDGWEHEITVLEVLDIPDDQVVPFVVKGKGACPPEDCGGAMGYNELKETLNNPQAEDYEEMLEWVGGEFDPKYFDIDKVNSHLFDQFIMQDMEDMIEERTPENLLINFSNTLTSKWSKEQLNAARKQFGNIVDLDVPFIKASMPKEQVQLLAVEYVEKIFLKNPKAVHILGEGSFFVMVIQLLERFGVECIESVFEKNVTLSKDGDKVVEYSFYGFREYI